MIRSLLKRLRKTDTSHAIPFYEKKGRRGTHPDGQADHFITSTI
jgi:hypothetical protein